MEPVEGLRTDQCRGAGLVVPAGALIRSSPPKLIGDTNGKAWYTRWTALADGIMSDAAASLTAGRTVSTRKGVDPVSPSTATV